MSQDSYTQDRIANRRLHPETLMMGFGYSPAMSEGSLKPPVFLTSTLRFRERPAGQGLPRLHLGRRRPKPARAGTWSIRA